MQIYLPIAEMAVNIFFFFLIGAIVGLLSGFFSIGGGFLLTPALIFLGIPATVAIATVPSQIVASLTSGLLAHLRKGNVDLKLAAVLSLASVIFSFLGILCFNFLRSFGQLDIIISISYILLLGTVGLLTVMGPLVTAVRHFINSPPPQRNKRPGRLQLAINRMQNLPFQIHFRKSNLKISIIPIFAIGGSIGFLGTMLGVGGGFILIPALVYLLRVPIRTAAGISTFNILITMISATMIHALTNKTVDVMLAVILMVGGVLGAQFGNQAAQKLKPEYLQLLLGLLIFAVGAQFLVALFTTPDNPFLVTEITLRK